MSSGNFGFLPVFSDIWGIDLGNLDWNLPVLASLATATHNRFGVDDCGTESVPKLNGSSRNTGENPAL